MQQTYAFFPQLAHARSSPLLTEVVLVIAGSFLLAALAQVAIPLGFTPVPITGQTFGVYLLALLWGRRLAVSAFLLYILEGSLGLPFFAAGSSGLPVGPTAGYFLGMFAACFVIGSFSDRMGATRSFVKSFLICLLGSLCVFFCGASLLSLFLPVTSVLQAGVLPFLPGDLLKITLASLIASGVSRANFLRP